MQLWRLNTDVDNDHVVRHYAHPYDEAGNLIECNDCPYKGRGCESLSIHRTKEEARAALEKYKAERR